MVGVLDNLEQLMIAKAHISKSRNEIEIMVSG
jgi:hypothetical protein